MAANSDRNPASLSADRTVSPSSARSARSVFNEDAATLSATVLRHQRQPEAGRGVGGAIPRLGAPIEPVKDSFAFVRIDARSGVVRRLGIVSGASGDLVWEWDFATDRVEWSFASLEGGAITFEQWRDRIHPADRARIVAVLDDLRAGKRDRWADAYRYLLPDGSTRIGQVRAVAEHRRERRLAAAGITPPAVMICADDVVNGKPDPEGYRKAADRLGVAPEMCVVFEDAPAGIEAGERMGAAVVVINVTHPHPMETSHLSISGYGEVSAVIGENRNLRLTSNKA